MALALAPLPQAFPGEFFVVAYDRETKVYTLIVDDESRSSYKLGDDVQAIMRYFKQIGAGDIGNRAIDVAREFGGAQAVLGDGRVLSVKEQQSASADPSNVNPFAPRADGRPRRGLGGFLPRV